jgi:hypothetical protein
MDDYLFGLKGNQSGLLNEVEKLFTIGFKKCPDEFNVRSYTAPTVKCDGRIETRIITVIKLTTPTIFEWLTKAKDSQNFKTVIRVEKTIEYTNGKEPNFETHYYILSLNLSAP